MRWILIVGVSFGCGGTQTDWKAEAAEIPRCDRLPAARPAGTVLRVSHHDGQSLSTTLDAAIVDDAPCPKLELPSFDGPRCVRVTSDAMDYVWSHLVKAEPHRIVMRPHGECIHCGGSWITMEWPQGRCQRGSGHFHEIATESQERFTAGVDVLVAAAAAGGVTATAPPY